MTADPIWRGFALDAETALALLDWQREMGVDEPMLDTPVDRYAEAARAPAPAAPVPAAAPRTGPQTAPQTASESDTDDLPARAAALASRAETLEQLAAAVESFDGLDIRKGARSFVFADGNPAARVMIVGEAPGEDEDRMGRPFVGRAGQLLDRMLDAIGLARDAVDAERAVYITNVLTWRPPGNRAPLPAEIDAMRPFLARHVELAAPDLLILMGNAACQAALGRQGVLRMRGKWATAWGRPAMPMTHPSYLLRTPAAKRDAWADLLEIAARLSA
ncbi:uracil-DNA glycosylase [Paracoccus sp. Z118]|uniref:uracil-DNA glycosylase n=1 Tax=Paracoccus sp. Z118 TaxID=2851017 RepID=UPI001C2C9521|nr:uracil-DNA glycosylase [Paracoccus sp. Z118]MBV0890781.1 uracil-DNA glycosylase [Paracoccus sp. Z118]